jgi:hypothetical protein
VIVALLAIFGCRQVHAETPACMKISTLIENTTLIANCPANSLRVETIGDSATIWCDCRSAR